MGNHENEPTPLDPEKYHVLNKKTKTIIYAIFAAFLIFVVPIFGFNYYKFAINRPSQTSDEYTFEIHGGDSVSEIAANLAREDVINSEFLFKLYLVSNNLHKNIQAGIYTIPAGSSVVDLAEMFQHGTNEVDVTFLEGWRVEEFAIEATSKLPKVDYEEFVKLAEDFEGYLFPDTYKFDVDATEMDVFETLRKTYDLKTKELLDAPVLAEKNLTPKQVVIFASIVEREVFTEEDRKLVAGILINRWRAPELIGADATTQYAAATSRICAQDSEIFCPSEEQALLINWWPDSLSQKDLEFDSPYNTRKNMGLPPKPISNPGLSSISAVVDYEDSNYAYYLTDSEGVTHYAKSLAEHNENIQKYL